MLGLRLQSLRAWLENVELYNGLAYLVTTCCHTNVARVAAKMRTSPLSSHTRATALRHCPCVLGHGSLSCVLARVAADIRTTPLSLRVWSRVPAVPTLRAGLQQLQPHQPKYPCSFNVQ